MKVGSVISSEVKVDGSGLPGTVQVYTIQVEKQLNRVATAIITVLDGNASEEKFTVSSSDTFVPGKKISIEAGYDGSNQVIFSGIITGQALRISNTTGPMLEVICKDLSVKMTVGRKSATFQKVKDSDVITQLIGKYSDLSADVSSTSVTQPELVQYYSTDWDFMLSRAEINGLVVSTINGTVSVFDPAKQSSSGLTLTYGDNLYEFHADLNAITQLAEVNASAWDYQNQQLINSIASNNFAGPGNLSSKKLSEVVGLSQFDLQTTAAIEKGNLTTWAKAQMLKSELAKILGEARLQGTSVLEPGKYITLDGLGTRFDGDHFVSAISHEISAGNWFTEAQVGLSPNWFVQNNQVEAPLAAGLLPGIQGLYNGTVKKMYDDPDNEYRILVDIPLFNDNGQGVWARLATFYATSGQGVFFLPEVGDEVIVGFLNQDPRYPVILGSVYSQKNKPYSALSPNQQNSPKAIVSKSELRILFDEEKKMLTLLTPGNNQVVLDDEGKQIEIKDQNGNQMVLSESGITIKSPANITIEADKAVSIKGNTGVSIEAAGGDVSLNGLNIKQTADIQYSAKGSTSAQVEGGASLTLKAAMVMIN